MKFSKLTAIAVAAMMIGLNACKKTEDTTPEEPQNETTQETPLPTFADQHGLLAAVQSVSVTPTPIGPITSKVDVAVANFFNGPNFFAAGTVSVNGYDLSKASNNAYILPSSGNFQLDLDFEDGVAPSWNVTGSTNVPAMTHTTNNVMPEKFNLTGTYATVDATQDLTVTINKFPADADSVIFVLGTEHELVTRTIGTGTSVTFTAAEMSNLSGSGVVQAAGYNFEKKVEGGKNYYFVNESVSTQIADFQK